MYLTNGWDFTKPEHRRAAWKHIENIDPYLVTGSPPFTLSCFLQELNICNNTDRRGWMENFERRKAEAVEHIK